MREPGRDDTLSQAQLSDLDTAHFGVRIARVQLTDESSLEQAQAYCRDNAVAMLIARCSTENIATINAAEAAGFRLMDTLVYYWQKPEPKEVGASAAGVAGLDIRAVRSGDAAAVRILSASCFEGYRGHYHADPRLDPARCDQAYADWAYRSCLERGPDSEVFVGEIAGEVVAFTTVVRHPADGMGENLLIGVAAEHRRHGIYGVMVSEALAWCGRKGCPQMQLSTQITNVPVQNTWMRLGFRLRESCYTLHKWY